ncbi:MAG: gliding motility-associated C-terminal domain-containing protein [Bacteroidales bacterium]|nr:gliding motility-associated C-terminal domain-containing protein [Bacteroidales bacterium]
MRKTIGHILILISLFIYSEKGNSQTLDIENVSVINEQGHVEISWNYTGAGNIIINRDSAALNNLSPLKTLLNTVSSYIDVSANAHKNPRSYKLQSEDTDLASKIVSTFYVTYKYDSCLQQIDLQWEDVDTEDVPNQWVPSQFRVNKTEEGVLEQFNVSATQNDYNLENIQENTNYTFSIETNWTGESAVSSSNIISMYTEMPESPDYINALSVMSNGDNTDLQFEVASNTELNKYRIYKSDSYNGIFDSIETVVSDGYIVSGTDYNSQSDSKISYYKLASVNDCDNETTNSDVINNIVLNLENTDFVNALSWNLLKEFDLFSGTYEIYRISGNSEPELIRSFSNYDNIEDDIELLQGQNLSGQFCYYIKVYKEGETENYSQSNTKCIYLEPTVYIPQAFTPNDDGINDLFLPVFSFLPKEYELKIYNRWGNIVFETSDPTKGWNGKQSNGKPAPAGSYIYLLKIKTEDNQTVKKRNNITVIYPQQ